VANNTNVVFFEWKVNIMKNLLTILLVVLMVSGVTFASRSKGYMSSQEQGQGFLITACNAQDGRGSGEQGSLTLELQDQEQEKCSLGYQSEVQGGVILLGQEKCGRGYQGQEAIAGGLQCQKMETSKNRCNGYDAQEEGQILVTSNVNEQSGKGYGVQVGVVVAGQGQEQRSDAGRQSEGQISVSVQGQVKKGPGVQIQSQQTIGVQTQSQYSSGGRN
jgi:hypothetical protein